MRNFLLASFFLILLSPASAFCADKADKKDEKAPNPFAVLEHYSEGTVESVIDPLTIRLKDGRLLHLTGLDYPDYEVYAPGAFSDTAIKVLRDFLDGENVKLARTKNKTGRINRMGHEIVHLTRKKDDIWVQGMIIGLGLARVRTEKDTSEMFEQMYKLEAAARAKKLGIWAIEAYSIANPENIKARIGSFQIVEGKIVSVGMKQNKTYLNFGHNWQKDFTVSLSPETRRNFLKQGLNPMDWNGHTVRVRGWVGSYNGPSIEIDHPQAIEILNAAPVEEKTTDTKEPESKKKTIEKTIFNKGNALPQMTE